MEGNKSHTLSIDDLEQALELTNKKEIKDEQSMLQGIIRFGDEMWVQNAKMRLIDTTSF